MRVHVTYFGKKTTISVDDVLVDYLGAWIVEGRERFYADSKTQFENAVKQIRRFVSNLEEDGGAATNLSQQVQSLIIEAIAGNGLKDILKARGPRYQKPPKEQFIVPNEWVEESARKKSVQLN